MRRLIVLLLMLCVWGSSGRRTERNIVCRNGTGYVHNGICCLNCPAGMFVKEPCSNELTMGLCQHCEFDTYTEYDNGIFPSCLKCTKCRPDQELVEQCSSTRNTRCQCKAGTFCLPDQACEICKTCRKILELKLIQVLVLFNKSRCKEDEKMVNSCTAFSNTVCDKRGSVPGNTSTGDDSLRKSFYLFAEIDVTFHNRFFRYIGLSDNTIRTTDMSYSSPEDKVYELLKTWMEKEGMKADFNSLIKALINLNQKLSAENITAKAIEHGYFRYED
ncbi:Tumor necrosis factor receptor superfamily member 22 [Bagarius yarrelli]|uniref:Tumor necrosis factor receptor superfamily member 22 n=1 Tax=Bagarius yarrelli TaxID=175774 RepID=A0A556V0W6_BAGYA|nr:Tumor necrosis factor receptor superfamily member 22 [Bagarius yarrelli]